MQRRMCWRWKDCTSRLNKSHMLTDRQGCRCLPHTKCMPQLMCLRGKDCMPRLNIGRKLTDRGKGCRYRLSMQGMLRLLTDRGKGCTSPRNKQCTSQRSRPRSSTTHFDNRRWAQ